MQYYAKTYTGDPKTGLISPGEFLTQEQTDALGAERIADMVTRGILCAVMDAPASEEAPKPAEVAKSEKKPAKKAEEPENAEDPSDGEEPETEEADEDLPELDGAGAIDGEETPAEAPTKKSGRRKTK